MQQFSWQSGSPEETAALAPEILAACKCARVFAIFGDLGAGKTTLVKALCDALGVTDPVKSPTYSLVQSYLGQDGPVYHFDFYRIERVEEAYDLGYEEYFDSGAWCFVEWPGRIEGLLPPDTAELHIETTGPASRLLTLTCTCTQP